MMQFEYFNARLLQNTALKIKETVGAVTPPAGYAFGVLSALTNLEITNSDLVENVNSVYVNTLDIKIPTEETMVEYVEYVFEHDAAKRDSVIIKSNTIPAASAELLGYEYQYMGETNNTYTHGFVYVCKGIPTDTLVFTPNTVSCDWADLSVFLQAHTADYNSVVAGSMTYFADAELWRATFTDANGDTVLTYQQDTGDWENVGFVFSGTFEDGDVVSFVRNTEFDYAWERVDLQPNHEQDIVELQTNVAEIQSVIPAQASASNQLADKNFVNSSISTNTANFIGTFNSVAELEAYSGTLTNNDYAFVVKTDSAGNTYYDRYKYATATTPASWVFEYELNNSSFIASQWAAINSGATSSNIAQIDTNKTNITNHIGNTNNPHQVTKTQVGLGNVDNTSDLNKPISTATQTALNGKQATISDLATIRSNAQAGKAASDTIATYGDIVTHNISEFATAAQGAKADTAVQPGDLATVATTGSYNDLSDKPTIPADISAHRINGAPLSDVKSVYFGTSNTAAATAEKVVNIPSIKTLDEGVAIIVLPTVTSTAANSTIKLNDFPAYPMRYGNAAITTSTDTYVWTANTPSIFVFDGSYWRFVAQGYRQVYSTMSVAEGNAGTATTGRVIRADYLKQIIQGTTLTGIDVATAGAVSASDTITDGIGKLQATKADKSELPTVGNGTITITQGGITKGQFTTNQSGNTTVALDAGGGGIGNIDNLTITANADQEIQTVATINANNTVGATNPIYDWVGTLAEYNAQNIETLHPDWVCFITDDLSAEAYEAYTKGETLNLLGGKVDKGHQLVEFQEPTAANGYTWYRKYADGWVEQGGCYSQNIGTGDTAWSATLPVPMSDNNYTASVNVNGGNAGDITIQCEGNTSTVVKGYGRSPSGAGSKKIMWRVEGMAA